jgi:curved DNA-binding protein CbpA
MDPFERLGLEKRLAISEDELREAFRAAGRREHPDAGGSGDGFTSVQEAFKLLSSSSRRLKAWMACKGISGDERGAISPGLLDLFAKVGAALQKAEDVTKRREAAQSALAKALLEHQVQLAREGLESALEEVAGAITKEEERFPEIEADAGDPAMVSRDLAFLEKWQAELKARFAGLW